jgi:hypothetical protein
MLCVHKEYNFLSPLVYFSEEKKRVNPNMQNDKVESEQSDQL